MNTFLTARHFNAREDLKNYIMDATAKLEKYYDGIIDCRVTLDYEQNEKHNGNRTKIVEIKVTVFNQMMKSKETSEHFEVAVDAAIDDIIKQLKKYKEMHRTH